jgi:hypothetical protein
MKRSFLAFIALFFVGLLCLIHHATSGFRAEKIHQHVLRDFSYDYSSPHFSKAMLDQPFFYLGKGRQAYVFASQDGRYVIKFLREQKYRPSLWMRAALFFQLLSRTQEKVFADQQRRLFRALESYHLAAEELSSQTELLRIHIGNEPLHKKILLLDALHRKFVIDLDKTSFLFQRKAVGLTQTLISSQENQQRLLVHHFFQTLRQRCEKKIVVRDAQCTLQNTAVIGERVIEIDVGSFYKDEGCSLEIEMSRSAPALRKLLEEKLPHLVAFFDEEYDRAIKGD